MAIGLVGKKIGMSRIFTEAGNSIPVTVIEVLPNRITQIKTEENDGYQAIQITTGEKKASRLNKAESGHFAKAQVTAGRGLWEFTVANATEWQVGQEITVDYFKDATLVDVIGVSKGRGFAGAIKRHKFHRQRKSHGGSLCERKPGSIGQNQTPGRVFKGKKMSGHMGDRRCTIQNLNLVKIDLERHLLLVQGAIPGCPDNDVIIKFAVKAKTLSADAVTA